MKRSNTGLRETLRLTRSFLEGNRRSVALVVVAATVSGFAEAIALVVIARLAFALATQGDDVALNLGPLGEVSVPIEVLIGTAAVLVIIKVALQMGGAVVSARLGARVTRKYREQLTNSYLNASWALQSGERSGRLQEMVGGFVNMASSAVSQQANALVALASLVAFLITALAVSAVAAFGVGLAAVGLGLLLRPLRTATRNSAGAASRANLVVATDVAETTAHLMEVRAFGAEAAVGRRLSDRIREAARFDARKAFLSSIAPVVYQGTALMLLVAAVAVLYAAEVTRLGAVGGVVLILLRSLSYGQSLQSSYQALHAAAPALEILRDELERYHAAAVNRSGAGVGRIGELAFADVSFEYESAVPVLRELSFVVPQGEIVGIVGPSGAGKSTLVQLVLRFREPMQGKVLADGVDVQSLALDEWYDHVSFVPQDPALFAGSIADNIRFYRDDIDQGAIERAAKLANLHDEIVAWPHGYDTPVGERGGQLSGGQRQRLCIARALAREPDVIAFDESTSALDVKSEGLVRSAMAGLAPKATVFVIAHRLSTLTICDRIMVLIDGKLQGFDTPDRLEANNRFYREALQLSGLR